MREKRRRDWENGRERKREMLAPILAILEKLEVCSDSKNE